MIPHDPHGWAPPAIACDFSGLEKLGKPENAPFRILTQLVQGCPENPVGNSVAAAMCVISCCQLAEEGLTPRIPSMILVNAHGTEGDPVDDFAKRLVADDHWEPPKVYNSGTCPFVEPHQAPTLMESAILQRKKVIGTGSYGDKELRFQESVFFDAQRTSFGCGLCRPYATAWQDKFGLLSERNCRVILRLATPEDRQAFHRDVVRESAKLVRPLGYGPGLDVLTKQFGVSGGIGLDLWDADFAQGVVNLPLPILVLPHATTSPLKLPDATLISVFTSSLHHALTGPIQEPDNFVPGPWFTHYAAELRKRLRHLPGDYEHTLQRLARQLFPACLAIVAHAGRLSKTKLREIEALALDLCAHALRGLTLSMAGLAWHGLGFDHGYPQEEVVRVLAYLRQKPPMTPAEFRRKAHLKNKEMRDVLLKQFLKEDLVRMDGGKMRATTFLEFVEALHVRKEFPQPENHSAVATKQSRPAA